MASSDLDTLKQQVAALQHEAEKQQRFETWVKIIAGLVAVITLAVGIAEYVVNNHNEFRKAIWKEQYALYQDACQNAAAIAIADNIENVNAERAMFWKLYWGKLSILEHPNVKEAMIAYGKQLRQVECGKEQPKSLQQLSYSLARTCRESLHQTWNPVELGDVDADK